MNNKEQPFANNQGVPPPMAPNQVTENSSRDQRTSNPSGNTYDTNQNYYQQYYNGYYANASNSNYYQQHQQAGYYYPQNFQAQGVSIPQGGYQVGHDYSSMYNQPGYNYSYNPASYPNYPTPSNYVAPAPYPEMIGTARPSDATQNQVQIKKEPQIKTEHQQAKIARGSGPSDTTHREVQVKKESEQPIITASVAPTVNTMEQVQIKKEKQQPKVVGALAGDSIRVEQDHVRNEHEQPIPPPLNIPKTTPSVVPSDNTMEQVQIKIENQQPKVVGTLVGDSNRVEQVHVRKEHEQSIPPPLFIPKTTPSVEPIRLNSPLQPPNIVHGMKSTVGASSSFSSNNDYNESRARQSSRPVPSKSLPRNSETARSSGSRIPFSRTVFNTDGVSSENSAPTTRSTRNLPSFESREKSSALFPPNLRTFLARIYKEFPLSKDNPDCEKELVRLVVEAATSGKLFSYNWETHPVPSIIKDLSCEPVAGKNPVVKKKAKAKKDTAPKSSDSDSEMDDMAKAMQNSHIEREEAADVEILNDRIKRFKPINKDEDSLFPIEVEPPSEQIRPDVIDWDKETIVGTCRRHEKSYFRLTSRPNPSLIRPLRILEEWYDKLMVLWNKNKDYGYFLDQFQAIRQDLTVQRIKNPFTVRTYETVARVALEKGDLGEFNKCQTTLIELYSHGIRGKECEFIAYRLLYYMHTRSQSDINKTLSALTKRQKADEAISHALKLFFAYNSLNYFRFFKLVQVTPNHGRHLIDQFLERERIRALITICHGIRQTIDVGYISSNLGFSTIQDCLDLLKKCKIVPVPASSEGGTSNSYLQFSTRPAVPLVEEAYTKFNKVDLKGQVN